jgi:hypothetical protein
MGRTKPILSKDYIVGLTDGEGCFYVNIRQSARYRAGYLIQMHFHIKMREEDKLLLEKVKKTLRCGAVYFQKEQRKNHSQCYRYTVNAQRDIFSTIIPFFKKYPLRSYSKKRSFNNFCKIAQLVKNKKHFSPKGIERIKRYKETMNPNRARVVREIRTLRGNTKSPELS